MSAEIIGIKRKPRPLRKTFQPKAPYVVEREDTDRSIQYHVTDERPNSYRTVCTFNDWEEDPNPWAKWNAEQVCQGLNMLVAYGLEQLPNVRKDD